MEFHHERFVDGIGPICQWSYFLHLHVDLITLASPIARTKHTEAIATKNDGTKFRSEVMLWGRSGYEWQPQRGVITI